MRSSGLVAAAHWRATAPKIVTTCASVSWAEPSTAWITAALALLSVGTSFT